MSTLTYVYFWLYIHLLCTLFSLPFAPINTLNPQSDDGWSAHRGPDGLIIPDPKRWPNGILNVSRFLHASGLKFGLYTSESSVVCSGRPGSLFYEAVDARSFADWEIDFIKVDNCAQYSYGNSRYVAMKDALNRSGRPIVVSTEPFSLVPTPIQGQFSHMFRTTNDVEASYSSSMNRADLNANWLRGLAGPGAWADPDCVMCGHGGVNEAECRSVFGVFAVSKAPLLLGSVIQNMTAETLRTVSNAGVIAINQDPLGIPGRKLAAGGRVSPHHVGLAPCTTTSITPGVNGVTADDLVWSALPKEGSSNSSGGVLVTLYHNASGRCLATQPYMKRPLPVPVLMPCDPKDPTQEWLLPLPLSITHVINTAMNSSLAVGESTVWGTLHGKDNVTTLDSQYGITNLTFEATQFDPPCASRDCENVNPRQSWYWSPSSGKLSLALFSGNMYKCYEGSSGCYDFTSILPISDDMCLTRVASISNDGLDTSLGGVHVWGGPLSGGDFAMVLENRDGTDQGGAVGEWAWFEVPGVGSDTVFCVTELYSGKSLGKLKGGVTLPLPAHDAAVLRLTDESKC